MDEGVALHYFGLRPTGKAVVLFLFDADLSLRRVIFTSSRARVSCFAKALKGSRKAPRRFPKGSPRDSWKIPERRPRVSQGGGADFRERTAQGDIVHSQLPCAALKS